YEDAPVQYEQLGRAVVKPNRLRLASDRRRVDLQRQPERDVLSGLDMAEAEGEAAVGGALRERLRCLPVDGVAVGPAGVEDERRSPEILQGVDAKAGGVDQAASRVCRSGDRQS